MELVARLTMVLVGFLLAFLGVITFINSDHYTVGVLLSVGGCLITLEGLPKYE